MSPAWKRLRPVPEESGNPANPPEQDGRHGCPEGTAPEEWICNMNISVHTLMHQGGSAEALSCQFPESSPGFILFREVTN